MDRQGRLYIPKAVRQSLGIASQAATLELDVRVVNDD
jgi:bifunctional DNA-binding transcriptional regulator/antitoxin component of YhaV-PrlF toxin-antitoxin module